MIKILGCILFVFLFLGCNIETPKPGKVFIGKITEVKFDKGNLFSTPLIEVKTEKGCFFVYGTPNILYDKDAYIETSIHGFKTIVYED